MWLPIIVLLIASGALVYGARLAMRPLPAASPISADRDRKLSKLFLVVAIVVAGVGVIPFGGMPGFLWLWVTEPLGRMACPGRAWGDFQSGVSWPAAILMTPPWGLSLVPGYRIARLGTSRRGLIATSAGGLGFVVLTGVALALFFYILGCTW